MVIEVVQILCMEVSRSTSHSCLQRVSFIIDRINVKLEYGTPGAMLR